MGPGSIAPGKRLNFGPGDRTNSLDDKNPLDSAYNTWKVKPNGSNLKGVIKASDGLISSAITSFAPGSAPAVRSQAKILVSRALKTYDPSKAKLKTHLYNNLRPLIRESRSYETLHLPERVSQDLAHLKSREAEFTAINGRAPNDEELADFTRLSKKRLHHIRKYDKNQVSEGKLLALADDGGDTVGGTGGLKVREAENLWETYIYEGLSSQDKFIYDSKIGTNGRKQLSVSDIARKLNISPSAISQRLQKISNSIIEGADLNA